MNSVEHLFSPGPLTALHAKYENDCAKCHYAFRKKNQNDLCLDCHKKVAQDLKTHQNFHGRSIAVKENQCRFCHTDHKGQMFDIKHLDKKTFNHNITGFILLGAHARQSLNCQVCHLQGKEYHDAPVKCFGCHSKKDSHKGRFGKDCAACHNETVWSQVHFDHNQKTHFSLLGKHDGLRCASCHKDNFKKLDIDSSCYSCHKKEDAHKSSQGTKCESCHNQNGWKEATGFDHGLTNFPLLGLHAVVSCGECHISSDFKELDTSCFSCHRNDDYHKGILGQDCAKCHNPNGWNLWEFDHNSRSAFKLEGAHEGIECQACHRKPIGKDKQLSGRCFFCHENDDRHDGRFGEQCDQCHTVESFKKIALLNKL